MIVARINIQIKPEEKSNFLTFMKQSIALSQDYDGSIAFGLYNDVLDDNGYILYEEWANKAAFDQYLASDHMKESRDILFPMMDGTPNTAYFGAEVMQ